MEYIWNMNNIQIESVEQAYESVPVLSGLLGLLSRATVMGLLPGKTIDRIDAQSIRRVFDALQRRGLLGAQRARLNVLLEPKTLRLGTGQDAGLALQQAIAVLEESPVPESEWTSMRQVLEDEMLADLLRISVSSLRRYASGERTTPTAIADRLHWLAMVVSDLAGSYNEFGIRRWFVRERSQLDGCSPRAMLGPRWQSNDAAARQVRALAASLANAGAT
jgi:hypothetical protein